MNFFPAKLRKDDGGMVVDGDGFTVKLPNDRIDPFVKLEGKEIIFGIRPEDIYNPAFVPAQVDTSPVEAKVDVTELMGNEIFLYLVTGKTSFVARVDPRTGFQIGDHVQVLFNMDNFHIFDLSTDRENPIAVR